MSKQNDPGTPARIAMGMCPSSSLSRFLMMLVLGYFKAEKRKK